MELILIHSKTCEFSKKAMPFVDKFAVVNNLKLTKYAAEDNNIPNEFDQKNYPTLFFVNEGKILGLVKGFSTEAEQLNGYQNELFFAQNPEKRPRPLPEENKGEITNEK